LNVDANGRNCAVLVPATRSHRPSLTSATCHERGAPMVVLRVADITTAEEVAARYGALTRFREHRTGDGFELDESEMTVAGLPITLLATDLP
jgi:hypothetical protein